MRRELYYVQIGYGNGNRPYIFRYNATEEEVFHKFIQLMNERNIKYLAIQLPNRIPFLIFDASLYNEE